MAANIYDLSTTAGSNTTIDGVDVSGATGKVKDGDNVMRSLAAFTAQWIDDQGGVATTAGTANAQTVTLASGFTAYAAGQIFRVKIGSGLTNTSTTVTINVNSIGTKTVKVNYDGVLAAPLPGDIRAGAYATFLYDGTYLVLLDAQQQARYPTGHLYGLTLSNNGSDATNDIDIAVGTCRDSGDAANIDLTSALTKQLDAAWAVGTNAGMLATGVAVTNTTYYLFIIKRPDTGVVDIAADTSRTGANIATNTNAAYTLKTLIGYVVRTGGVNGTPIWFGTSGPIGEYVFSSIASGSAVSLTNVTAANVTSISLTAGDWDVWGSVNFYPAGTTTMAALIAFISTTSASLPTLPNGGAYTQLQLSFSTGLNQTMSAGRVRLSLSSTTTVYLEGYASFGVSTMTAGGFIGARRVR